MNTSRYSTNEDRALRRDLLAPNTITHFTMTLPRDAGVKARFCHESVAKKLAKLFKHELQTGDAYFDAEVYITTDTPERTAKLLESDDVRRAIALSTATSGPIEIQGATVTMKLIGEQDGGDDAAAVTLARALLAL